MPMAPEMQINVDFQVEIVPADGIRLPFSGSGDFGTSPFFGQHLVKLINSTVRQRTILVRNTQRIRVPPARCTGTM